ncbi:hypothetical protein [Paracraurococcus lichenis]|uniref:Uncharacterized protein n=1 Tax=Paracraurococcus lichenis TaxID=3064888 RepID=A0ABT9DTZ6_9PROT|nr:hypothetical protein [Paracraurococcus sp. LOR1-02]MDO9707372.1 hypothetical protein [Paracraurococcus sp. LOR1-02]
MTEIDASLSLLGLVLLACGSLPAIIALRAEKRRAEVVGGWSGPFHEARREMDEAVFERVRTLRVPPARLPAATP